MKQRWVTAISIAIVVAIFALFFWLLQTPAAVPKPLLITIDCRTGINKEFGLTIIRGSDGKRFQFAACEYIEINDDDPFILNRGGK